MLVIVTSDTVERELPMHQTGRNTSTLLYIEDNETNIMLVEQMVSTYMECRFLVAVDGDSGLESIRQEKPDLVLLDIGLPGMSGYDVLSAVRKNSDTSGIPVVAMSANATVDDVNKGMSAGFDDYLTKPVRFPDLVSVLNKYLGLPDSA